MSKEQEKSDACDWLENLEGDAWADACEEIAGAVKRQAEGAQGEREAFEAWVKTFNSMPAALFQDERGRYIDDWIQCRWMGWQARAALAQPSPAPELDDQEYDRNAERLTLQALGSGAGINPEATSIDDLFLDEAPAPGMERPEVVAWMWRDINGDMQFNYMHPEGEPLMTVAQHDRIVGALRARNEWLEQVAVEAAGTERHAKGLADGLRYKAELYDEVWALVTGKGYMNVTTAISVLEQQRDAAQARFAELEARAFLSVPTDAMLKAYREVSPSWLCLDGWRAMMEAAPVAQAGQVPEGYALIPTRLLLDKELIECIAFHCGDGGGSYGDYQDGILFIGEITDDDGRQVHGLHLACAECEEEGYTTLVEFAAAPAQGGE